MFNACFSFLYSKLAPPLDSTSPLSESEMALLDFIGIFKFCGPGRIEQLRTLYEDFKSRLPKKFQELRRKKDDLRSFLYESYRDILENFLKENRELFRALHGKLSNVHESDYLKNLLGKRLGLLNVDDVTFDISTECIHSEIIEKNSSELFRFILNRFTPEMLVLKMQQKLIRLLEEEISAKDKDDSMKDEAPMGSKLGSWLGDFLTGSKMGWYYDMSVEMADPDPSKELLSKELIQKILIYAGLLEKREEGSITIYKSYVSVGVDELGRLRK
jgi:sporulation protein YlmC with PRC-barrel domain